MNQFEDNLWNSVVDRHGDELAQADTAAPSRSRLGRLHPRVLAGSSLGLAGVGAALVLALGGSAATSPAFAITRTSNGSVLVKLNYVKNLNLPQLEQQLESMGTGEVVQIQMAPGSAPVAGPVTCARASNAAGPAVQVLVGSDGTEAIAAGQSAGNTAEGSFHLAACTVSEAGAGNTGTATGATATPAG